jgi:predicted MFS family arabinose efflux permease
MAVVSAAVMLSTGSFIDRKGLERDAMIAGYTALGLGSLGFILATQIGHVFVAQGVNGVGLGLVKPSWKELYARYEDAGQEVQEWGWADGSAQLLTGVASFFGGLIVEAFSFTALFVTMGVLQVCAALAGFGLQRDA